MVLDDLQRKYVIIPADKAPGNIVFARENYYNYVLICGGVQYYEYRNITLLL